MSTHKLHAKSIFKTTGIKHSTLHSADVFCLFDVITSAQSKKYNCHLYMHNIKIYYILQTFITYYYNVRNTKLEFILR